MKKLIDKLASKELSFGCFVKIPDSPHPKDIERITEISLRKEDGKTIYGCTGYAVANFTEEDFEILGHPVYKHHVEEAIMDKTVYGLWDDLKRLTILWEKCGLSNSLQTISEKSGYETYCKGGHLGKNNLAFCDNGCLQRLKDPKARELEQFISNLIL